MCRVQLVWDILESHLLKVSLLSSVSTVLSDNTDACLLGVSAFE